jgi:hypothetical protein
MTEEAPDTRPWTLYERDGGRVIANGIGEPPPVAPGQAILRVASQAGAHYVSGRVVMLRTEMPVEVDGRTIRGLPSGSRLVGNGLPPTEAEGDWTAPVDAPSPLLVSIDHPHYLPRTVELRDYRADRVDAYLPPGDQLDAIAKGFRALRDAGVQLPAETAAWLDSIAAVKAAHPKD